MNSINYKKNEVDVDKEIETMSDFSGLTIENNPEMGVADKENEHNESVTLFIDNAIKPTILEHSSVLNALMNELKPIDFFQRAKLGDGEKLENNHFLVISIEEILDKAKENYWSLCTSNGFLYVFNGAYWKQISKEEMSSFLGQCGERLGVEIYVARFYTFREALVRQFWSASYLPKPESKRNEVLINLKNGTFVITPDKQYLRGFDRSDFITYQLSFDYDESKQAPLFNKYLDKVLPDQVQQKVLAEYVGYVFVKQKKLKLEKAMVLFGSGANGKSVFFDIVCELLGRENVSNYTLESLTNSNGYSRAKLGDKLLNYASEISPNMDSTVFKQLVSGEAIEARLPYKEPFLLQDYAKFIFNTNTLPKDVEHNEAFFRRFILINFNVTIPEDQRDTELANKIISNELPGVFNWVLEGLKRLLANGNFTFSPTIDQAVKQYRLQSDTVHLFLDDNEFVASTDKEIALKELYTGYKNYCSDSGFKQASVKTFSERIRNLGYDVTRKSGGNVVGIMKKSFETPAFVTSNTSIDF